MMRSKMIDTEFLMEQDKLIINRIFKHDLLTDCYIRFWDKRTVQLDGEMTLPDLKSLVQIMEEFQNRGEQE